ncbi:hypothetical protein OAP87_03840 [Flavobacteriaceae bacterium]|jgi:hypothetical protein|nr:hypothetical protein [Flavobacteriaceae bacterium]MDB2685266.1 hypothetical protein [Flavobacteriaceae bacterium]MDC0870475.1 hypothetical protein [Flavobacteriaceae bacterium]|tara:strand:+ start:405 stop:695 length:291 start_codon:yes stop_codon:yes gene_type:complete
MSNTIEAVNLLEIKLKNLLSNYDFLLKENELLLQNSSKLQHQLLENKQLLEQREEQFKLLKIAKTIEGSDNSTRDTKFKINALIREIDKCIVQLNE